RGRMGSHRGPAGRHRRRHGPGSGDRHSAAGCAHGVRAARRGRAWPRGDRDDDRHRRRYQQGSIASRPPIVAGEVGQMNCETIDANLDDWLDGLLDEARAQAFEAHLRECAACTVRAERARTLLAAAHRLPPEIPPSRDLWPGIAARLEAPAAPRRRQPAWFRALAASVAAAGIFMAGMLANQVLENRPAQDALVTERPAPRLPDVEQARNLLPA